MKVSLAVHNLHVNGIMGLLQATLPRPSSVWWSRRAGLHVGPLRRLPRVTRSGWQNVHQQGGAGDKRAVGKCSSYNIANNSQSLNIFENDRICWVYIHDFFRCTKGYEAKAAQVAHKACYKLVTDMNYEPHIQAIITYHASINVKVKKEQARNMTMTREQFLLVYIQH